MILYGAREPFESADLLVEPAAIGWEAEFHGLCRDDVCVPFSLTDGRVDLPAFAQRLGQPVVQEGDVWSFGDPKRAPVTHAPDFTLPDVEGRPHSLFELRGEKVMLVTWASW